MKSICIVMVVNLVELIIVVTVWIILFWKRLISWILRAYGWIGFGANWVLEIENWLERDLVYKLVQNPNSKIMVKKGLNHGFNQWVVNYHFDNCLQVTTLNKILFLKQGSKFYQTSNVFSFNHQSCKYGFSDHFL
jgi:hypothetical protein